MKKSPIRTALQSTVFTLLALLATPALSEFDAGRFAAAARQGMDLWHVPGLSATVVSPDEVLFQQGFGSTAARGGSAVDEHTLFAIASTTKAMLVTGILMLADEGKLSLDDPIARHIPELHFSDPSASRQLSVRDLLTHRTGLPSTDYWAFFQDMPLDEQIALLPNVPMAAPPRARVIYQNTMYEVAGLLFERLDGRSWDEFLRERLWGPIGMLETFGSRARVSEEHSQVTPYYFKDDELVEAGWDFADGKPSAAGSVWSSAHDMGLWAQFLLRGGVTADGAHLVSEGGFAEMFEPQQLVAADSYYPVHELTRPNWRSYGLGWYQQDFQGRKIDFHTGSLSGLVAIIGLDFASERAVIVLGNRDHAEMRHALLWEVMDERGPGSRPDWNQAVFDLYERLAGEHEQRWEQRQQGRLDDKPHSLPIGAYAGRYRGGFMGEVQVEVDGDKLLLRTRLRELQMTNWHLDTFLVEYAPWSMRQFAVFNIGPGGAVESFEMAGDTFTAVKAAADQ